MKHFTWFVQFGFVWVFLVCLSPAFAKDEDQRSELIAKEIQRRNALIKWIRTAQPTQEVAYKRLHEPVYKGNTEDYQKNLRLAERNKERAKDALGKNQEEAAKKYMEVALLFHEASQINKQIVEAIGSRDQAKLDDGFRKIVDVETKLSAATGRQVPREWFTPAELAASRRKSQKGDGKRQDEKVPPAEGRKAGDK